MKPSQDKTTYTTRCENPECDRVAILSLQYKKRFRCAKCYAPLCAKCREKTDLCKECLAPPVQELEDTILYNSVFSTRYSK